MTAWTKHALNREGPEWFVEAHDDWPERRSLINLLDFQFDDLPENTGGYTVRDIMAKAKPEQEE